MDINTFANLLSISLDGTNDNSHKAGEEIIALITENPPAFIELCTTILQNQSKIPAEFNPIRTLAATFLASRRCFSYIADFPPENPQISQIIPLSSTFISLLSPFLSHSESILRQQASTLYGQISLFFLKFYPDLPILSELTTIISQNTDPNRTISACTACSLILEVIKDDDHFSPMIRQIGFSVLSILAKVEISDSIRSSLICVLSILSGHLSDFLSEESLPNFLATMVSWTRCSALSDSCWTFWNEILCSESQPLILSASGLPEAAIEQLQQPEPSNSLFEFFRILFESSSDVDSPFHSFSEPIAASFIPHLFTHMVTIDGIEGEDETSPASNSRLVFRAICEAYPGPTFILANQFLSENINSKNPGNRRTAIICLSSIAFASNDIINSDTSFDVLSFATSSIQHLIDALHDSEQGVIFDALTSISEILNLNNIKKNYSKLDLGDLLTGSLHYLTSFSETELGSAASKAVTSILSTGFGINQISDIIHTLLNTVSPTAYESIHSFIQFCSSEVCHSLLYQFETYTEIAEESFPQLLPPLLLSLSAAQAKAGETSEISQRIATTSIRIYQNTQIPEALTLMATISSPSHLSGLPSEFSMQFLQSTFTSSLNVLQDVFDPASYQAALLFFSTAALPSDMASPCVHIISSLLSTITFSEIRSNCYEAISGMLYKGSLASELPRVLDILCIGVEDLEKIDIDEAGDLCATLLSSFTYMLINGPDEMKPRVLEAGVVVLRTVTKMRDVSMLELLNSLDFIVKIAKDNKEIGQSLVDIEEVADFIASAAQDCPKEIGDFFQRSQLNPPRQILEILK